ncbi:MAG: hypothetical protein K8H84_09685 [Sulfuricella denitrificans]|nr:hypothetical protein [Sulfuricella denitrificans]
MSIAETFRDELSSLVSELVSGNRPVVIFGAARGGWYLTQVLTYHGVTIAAFADSNPNKQGAYLGMEVLPINEAIEKYPEAVFLPSLLNPKNLGVVMATLKAAGAKDIRYFIPQSIYSYFTEIEARNCDHSALAESIGKYYSGEGRDALSFSPSVSCVVTQKCTLCCKDCGAFVPENAAPKTYSVSNIVEDIRKYCSAFDIVHHIALQGGEPFMHREIMKIVEEVSSIPNLLFIDLVTNGTIVPKLPVLRAMARNGACVIISDYGPASTMISPLTDACSKNGIFVDYYNYTENNDWGMQTPIQERQRGEKENDAMFQECVSNPMICCQIMNGKVHRCTFSNFTENLGLIPTFNADSVDLTVYESGNPELVDGIRSMAYRKTALNACDYCPAKDRIFVPAGIQIAKPKKKRAAMDNKS